MKSSLVYDKHSTEVIGFVDLGEVNAALQSMEEDESQSNKEIATYVLGVMVRGLFNNIKFPYAHFPTTTATGDSLFNILWEAIERFEFLGFKVIACTGDSASQNRKFFKLHKIGALSNDMVSGVCFRTPNCYSEEGRYIHFFADVPHLMKTARNCWARSYSINSTRNLWVSGMLRYRIPYEQGNFSDQFLVPPGVHHTLAVASRLLFTIAHLKLSTHTVLAQQFA